MGISVTLRTTVHLFLFSSSPSSLASHSCYMTNSGGCSGIYRCSEAWNVGKRSQCRLQMGAAILGKWNKQLWRGVHAANIACGVLIRPSGDVFLRSPNVAHGSIEKYCLSNTSWCQFNCWIIVFNSKPQERPTLPAKHLHFARSFGVFSGTTFTP